MIVDTSVIIAILKKEPERDRLLEAIATADHPRMSAANVLECGIVAESMAGGAGAHDLDLLLFRLGIDIVAFTPDQTAIARKAHREFGKRRHRAGLNLGDCIAYALARDTGEPLLFRGNDFSRTDVVAAEY
jgi:ribonuclease VapC